MGTNRCRKKRDGLTRTVVVVIEDNDIQRLAQQMMLDGLEVSGDYRRFRRQRPNVWSVPCLPTLS